MEEPDHTIESDEETSGVDAPSEEGEDAETSGFDLDDQPSEATKWAEEADGEDAVLEDDDLAALEDDDEPNDLD
jgi:hypothetical protein